MSGLLSEEIPEISGWREHTCPGGFELQPQVCQLDGWCLPWQVFVMLMANCEVPALDASGFIFIFPYLGARLCSSSHMLISKDTFLV